MPLLAAHGLTFSAGGQVLHRDLSLELDRGEMVGLVGPSGSGKTTLLRCLALLQDPDRGQLSLDGQSPDDLGYPRWRRQVMLVGQRPVLLDASVRDNLARPFTFATAGASFPEATARTWLERLYLEASRMNQNATTLSEGQMQRVSLVRGLLLEPAVLLLDEPTAALDSKATDAAERLLRERIEATGGAALVVTHDQSQAKRLCDRLVELAGA